MENKETKLVKNTIIFSVGNAGAKLLILLIVPLYTYYVTTSQMGQYDLISTYVSLFAPLACLAIHEGIYRWLLDSTTSNEDVLRTGVTLSIGLLLAFDVLAGILLIIINFSYTIEFILLVDVTAIYTMAQFITRGLRNNKTYAVQGIIYTIVLIVCNLVLVVWLKLQVRGLLFSMIIAYSVTIVFICSIQHIVSNYYLKGRVQKQLSKELIKFSVPIVPNNIAWWLVSAVNRLLINWGIGDTANGIYAIAMKFPSVVTMLSTFFYQAWQEQAISEYDSEERDKYYTKIFNIYVTILLTGVLVLLPITKFIIVYFMDNSYHEAFLYTGFLYLSSVFNALAAFYGTGYLSVKKTSGSLTTTIYGAIANVIVTVALIKVIGLYAASLGTMIGNAVIWLLRILQCKKFFNIRIKLIPLVLLFTLNMIAILLTNMSDLYMMIALEIAFCAIFIAFNKEMVISLYLSLAKRIKKTN